MLTVRVRGGDDLKGKIVLFENNITIMGRRLLGRRHRGQQHEMLHSGKRHSPDSYQNYSYGIYNYIPSGHLSPDA